MLNSDDIWRTIPPEEKLELLARSQYSGIMTSLMLIGISFTMAIALKIPWLIWASILGSPLLFQVSAHKKWRDIKPKRVLEYLAARTVARRFAYAANSDNLYIELLFKGQSQLIAKKKINEIDEKNAMVDLKIKEMEEGVRSTATWIALLPGAVVGFREGRDGATLEFVSAIDKRMLVNGESPDSETEYANDRTVFLTMKKSLTEDVTFKLTSDYPAALVAFEQSLKHKLDLRNKLPDLT